MNSKRRPFYFLATAALIVAAPRAKAELIQVTWDSNGRYEHQLTVAPAKFAEVCDRLKPGAQVQWTFEGSAPMNFNIHYHEDKAVRFPAKEDGSTSSKGTLNVTSEQVYCWTWSNKGQADVRLKLELLKQP
ncbi:hypothetical protein [Pelomonas aquatica]|jgi:hypothetical protein|uniref:Uncharacterized protein n=3 Tax=Pseudomonadota TaxID=1224 RepID=A0A9X4LEQ6_9BURK|nr:hypothetical protein [Pelomonas aquatica]MBY0365794.1 hypothetical protein [Burkholderiaceae bacterium]MCY4754300.1 hypothetical protein [Pelomonas aquatica]MDG0861651.1 hypothetical protein [Pelomonas aquatica]RTL24336.1 MAG: hypothetical protein EKK52_01670 [Burkholderiales bacterium]|mmetsp:Transcript_61800/g.146192  ORF Transcript_61800/g.146192 Transcript_61800/m.146192 type:complete len:131 (+) Transcript_61800:413-805(+)